MSKRADRAFLGVGAFIVTLAACAAVAYMPHPHHHKAAPVVVYPHATSCRHPDALTAPACTAVADLLDSANQQDAKRLCRHIAPTREYKLCVAKVAFTDAFSYFQTVGFYVVGATLEERYVARVRVRLVGYDNARPLLRLGSIPSEHVADSKEKARHFGRALDPDSAPLRGPEQGARTTCHST